MSLNLIRMVAKLFYPYLEGVSLKFIRTVPTRELSQHVMSLTLQHRVFLVILRPSYFVFQVFLSQPCIKIFCLD